ncbi:putative major capsid protein [Gokushovirinae GAIR4]|uniref:putative major capsid protein n=1 Tax=Gokushovirinae GAIR4 TaxID=1701404 RepID=UPI0006CC024C|nr:putative major capsid protein [Gokushovirinae GAIR4]ALE15077.1 putative major capsid protein [Gokushovirinae GAIR4]
MTMMHKNRSVDPHRFAMIPHADIPRAKFDRQFTHKTTFDAGYLVPVYVDEVLPGDTFNLNMTAFARLATPFFLLWIIWFWIVFFFFVPNRLIWDNWQKFMVSSVTLVIRLLCCSSTSFSRRWLCCWFFARLYGFTNCWSGWCWQYYFPLRFFTRAYNLIWNEWFRDQNLQNSVTVDTGDGPDASASTNYTLLRRGKRHDYFTSALPWPQKGSSVTLPLGTSAPIKSDTTQVQFKYGATTFNSVSRTDVNVLGFNGAAVGAAGQAISFGANTGLYADLSQATAATINQLRQSFQIQKLLERDARGGTRYTEIIRAHFGVISPDARLQRPEYLGGGSTPVIINPIAQTSGTGVTGGSTPLANLAGVGTVLASGHGFTQSFTEHGVIIGLVSIRADLTYQQGLHRMWSRSTRYDFYFPAFAMLGEQPVYNRELYIDGSANDGNVFGYQERWAEYRYKPSQISSLFKSTSAGTIDAWHLAQKFTSLPTLNSTFIQENPPVSRVVAVGAAANGQQFIFDSFFHNVVARPMPLYSVPGMIDHF